MIVNSLIKTYCISVLWVEWFVNNCGLRQFSYKSVSSIGHLIFIKFALFCYQESQIFVEFSYCFTLFYEFSEEHYKVVGSLEINYKFLNEQVIFNFVFIKSIETNFKNFYFRLKKKLVFFFCLDGSFEFHSKIF